MRSYGYVTLSHSFFLSVSPLCAACNIIDERFFEQREVTFDIPQLMQGVCARIHILARHLHSYQLCHMLILVFGQLSLQEEC